MIFEETGGKITDLDGKNIDFGVGRALSENWGLIAADERIHARVLAIAKEFLRKDGEIILS